MREDDYRPGASCMECGDYPGPKHERSDCSRAVIRRIMAVADELEANAIALGDAYGDDFHDAADRIRRALAGGAP